MSTLNVFLQRLHHQLAKSCRNLLPDIFVRSSVSILHLFKYSLNLLEVFSKSGRFCAHWNNQYYCIDCVLLLDANDWCMEQLLDTRTAMNATLFFVVIVNCCCDFGIACSCYCLFCSSWWCWCWCSIIHNQQQNSRDRCSRLAIFAMLDLQT